MAQQAPSTTAPVTLGSASASIFPAPSAPQSGFVGLSQGSVLRTDPHPAPNTFVFGAIGVIIIVWMLTSWVFNLFRKIPASSVLIIPGILVGLAMAVLGLEVGPALGRNKLESIALERSQDQENHAALALSAASWTVQTLAGGKLKITASDDQVVCTWAALRWPGDAVQLRSDTVTLRPDRNWLLLRGSLEPPAGYAWTANRCQYKNTGRSSQQDYAKVLIQGL